jgi:cytochrome c biogenesis protein CcmG/thiol:disulfide interchange protein DsbE
MVAARVIAAMARPRPSRRLLLALLPLAAAVAVGACGGDSEGGGDPVTESPASPAAVAKDLPRPLAENRAQASELIDGETEALEAKLADLRGHPVVVNQWGSWCPPCRAEFPFFAALADEHADEVAFLGVDIQDDRGAAEEFLREFPVPYPSIFDPDADAVRSLDWAGFSPTTWFIDERGEIVFVRNGAYPDQGTLNADIHNYLLRG